MSVSDASCLRSRYPYRRTGSRVGDRCCSAAGGETSAEFRFPDRGNRRSRRGFPRPGDCTKLYGVASLHTLISHHKSKTYVVLVCPAPWNMGAICGSRGSASFIFRLHQFALKHFFVYSERVSGEDGYSYRFALKHFFVYSERVSGEDGYSYRFALKHFYACSERVSGEDGYSYRFALKHFYAQKGR